MDSRTCANCGADITDKQQSTCPGCGAALSVSVTKNPILAAVLSLIIPGLGQSYNGNALKGLGMFFGVGLLLVLLVTILRYSDVPVVWIIPLLIWIFGGYDAYRDTGLMNQGKIPEKKHQILLFFGGALAVIIILAIVFSAIIFIFGMIGLAEMNPPVICTPGAGCITR